MLVTLFDLQSRIATVRRNIGDSFNLAVVRINVNGHWIEATRDTFVVDDSGALIIEAIIPEAKSPTVLVAADPAVKPTAPPAWKAAFERFRKNEYTDYMPVIEVNFSRERMIDAIEVAAAVDEAIEWGCRWEALASAQSELLQKMQHELQRLRKPANVEMI